MSPAAKMYFDLWVELDALFECGQGESAAADELRDRMDAPWYAMTSFEIDEVEQAIISKRSR